MPRLMELHGDGGDDVGVEMMRPEARAEPVKPVKWDSNGAISSVLCLLVKSTKLSIYPNLRMLNHTMCCCTSWKDSVDGMCFVDVSAAFYLLSCKGLRL